MSILTKLTREIAQRTLPASRYVSHMDAELSTESFPPVYLTFDDGPHPERTPPILDQLSKIGAKATFFVLGTEAKKHPDIVQRIIKDGHSVGTHTWSHMSAYKAPLSKWLLDTDRARNEIEQLISNPCRLFRPPYGELTPRSLICLLKNNYRIIHWSADTKDFEAQTTNQLKEWFTNNFPQPGEVVLMHDCVELTALNLSGYCDIWKDHADFKAIPID